MKKKILCLLMALAVVMSVVPLTALAEYIQGGSIPEEFQGTYTGTDYEGRSVKMIVDSSKAELIEPFSGKCNYESRLNTGNTCELYFANGLTLCISPTLKIVCTKGSDHIILSTRNLSFTGKDSTNASGSTLSTGSDVIIPVGAAVLLMGAVIFMGKRKKEKTE